MALIVRALVGGTPVSIVDGHFFVWHRGTELEVSPLLWAAVLLETVLTLVLTPLALLSGAHLLFAYVFPFLIVGKSPGHASVRVEEVRSSGPPIWSGNPGGSAGLLHLSAGMLEVAVHPAGIVVKPSFMAPFAVKRGEIRSVSFGRRIVSATIEVDHVGLDVESPLMVYGGRDSPQAKAILALLPGTRRDGVDR